ncbi:MAG: hypothetical protein O7B30_06445, partial [Thaumarchaeota archaeon]|nr:hypothetical protein [Nitrososphaerota archaeon]
MSNAIELWLDNKSLRLYSREEFGSTKRSGDKDWVNIDQTMLKNPLIVQAIDYIALDDVVRRIHLLLA